MANAMQVKNGNEAISLLLKSDRTSKVLSNINNNNNNNNNLY